jgi:hypothetical protein
MSGHHSKGAEVAKKLGVDYIESSAMKDEGVHDVFVLAARISLRIRDSRNRKCIVM